jgi:hypothetical protein
MKKLLYLFSATLLVLTSCSSDDNNSSDPVASTLLKKMVYVSTGESYTVDFTYSGNKLMSYVDTEGYKSTFTYTGDLVVKVVDTDEKGSVEETIDYTYTTGKLTSETRLETGSAYKYKTKYTHNADGTVSYEEFRVAVDTGVEQEYGYIGKFTFKDGNLIKEEKSYYGSDSSVTYEYDTKNSPLKNVIGFNLLMDSDYSINNVIKRTTPNDITTNTYTYNANGFPTEQKSFINGGSDGISTFTY